MQKLKYEYFYFTMHLNPIREVLYIKTPTQSMLLYLCLLGYRKILESTLSSYYSLNINE